MSNETKGQVRWQLGLWLTPESTINVSSEAKAGRQVFPAYPVDDTRTLYTCRMNKGTSGDGKVYPHENDL